MGATRAHPAMDFTFTSLMTDEAGEDVSGDGKFTAPDPG